MYALRGIDVLMVDFRGYGKSTGSPTETKVKLDLETAYQYLKKEKKLDNKNIILHGHCLAGAIASDLAARHPGVNLVLDRSFAEHREMIGPAMASGVSNPTLKKVCLKIAKIVKKILPSIVNFNTALNLEKVTGNVAIVKSLKDELVPDEQTDKLLEKMPDSGKYLFFEGGHDSSWSSSPKTCKQFDSFLERANLMHKLF
jgi:pimeloyl-ACP methyl ester carboxylesterase